MNLEHIYDDHVNTDMYVDGLEIMKTVNSVKNVQSKDKENICDDDNNDGDVTFMSATDKRVDEREDPNNSKLSNVNDTENTTKTSTSWDDNIQHYLLLLGERMIILIT